MSKIFPEIETKSGRDRHIHTAHVKYGYTLKEIADQLCLHYTTASKAMSGFEKK
ncbi:MAG: hypothetical protein AAB014_02675 [Nitrospirota bacterium]